MKQIGAFDAKTHFSSLLEQVEKGEEIIITRRGKQIAKIIPIQTNVSEAHAAVTRIKNLAKKLKLGKFNWDEWKQYRDEGRK